MGLRSTFIYFPRIFFALFLEGSVPSIPRYHTWHISALPFPKSIFSSLFPSGSFPRIGVIGPAPPARGELTSGRLPAAPVPPSISATTSFSHMSSPSEYDMLPAGMRDQITRVKATDLYHDEVTLAFTHCSNRELQIMLRLNHPNVIKLRYWYRESANLPEDPFALTLNLVLDFIPETIYKTYTAYTKRRQTFPEILVKLYMYQLLRALAYVHSIGICHRDIKPHNILVNPDTGVMTLIDFGSAKVLTRGEPNVSYTCSRYYRAPELIFGSTTYEVSIDVWSAGCVLGELLSGKVMFPGSSGIDQLVEIIKTLGTPSRDEISMMNPAYIDHVFPRILPISLGKGIPKASPESVDLLTRVLLFNPDQRLTSIEAMIHPYFDNLKDRDAHMPNGNRLPPLYNFTRHELSIRPDLIRQLVPPCEEQALYNSPERIDLRNFQPVQIRHIEVGH